MSMFVRIRTANIKLFFFFNDTATTEIYTLSLHDALPISAGERSGHRERGLSRQAGSRGGGGISACRSCRFGPRDRKSTRLNSSHDQISYAVFCLKKKNTLQRSGAVRVVPRLRDIRCT